MQKINAVAFEFQLGFTIDEMVSVSILPREEFRRNDHQEEASHFSNSDIIFVI